MNKKVGISSTIVLTVALGLAIYQGSSDWNKALAEQGRDAAIKNEEYQQQQIAKREAEINKWKPNGSPRSYIDDIRYYKVLKNTVNIFSTLGSSVTAGAGASDYNHNWSSLLVNYISTIDGFTPITLNNNGFGGYTTEQIIKTNKINTVISQKPDIVLFETCLINDHGTSIPIDKTLTNISTIVTMIHSSLPDAKIILMSPNPILEDVKNKDGLLLADYVIKTNEYIKKNGWDYIDVYNGFKDRNAVMEKLLSDEVHPNDDGYKMWFEILKSEFEKKK